MTGLLFFGDFLRDRDQDIHRQQTHAVLVIACKVLEEGYHFVNNHGGLHLLHELGQVVGRLPPHHRGLIVYQGSKVLSEVLLQCWRGFSVGGAVQTCGGDLGCEPIGFREVENERDEMLLNLALRQLLADFVERFDGLIRSISIDSPSLSRIVTHLLPDQGLLNCRQILQR